MKKLLFVVVTLFFLASIISAVTVSDNTEKNKIVSVGKDKALEKNETGKDKRLGESETETGKGVKKNETEKGKPDKPLDDGNKTSGGPVQAIDAINKSIEKKINKSLEKRESGNVSIEARLLVIQKLRQKIQEGKTGVDNETNNNKDKTKQFKNQNIVRDRVMSLLALENMTEESGIGQQIAEVARGFNNSISKTQKAEEQINNRGGIRRFLFGGDHKAADEIDKEVAQNQARISQLKELRKTTGEEIRQFIDEQLSELEVEQNRLNGLAHREKKSKGIFGWILK